MGYFSNIFIHSSLDYCHVNMNWIKITTVVSWHFPSVFKTFLYIITIRIWIVCEVTTLVNWHQTCTYSLNFSRYTWTTTISITNAEEIFFPQNWKNIGPEKIKNLFYLWQCLWQLSTVWVGIETFSNYRFNPLSFRV